MIKQNEGIMDRIIRIVVGIIAFFVGYTALSGIAQTIAYVISVVALITGVVGFCGLYAILGISTNNKK